ncbi:MAG: hypothetical protein HYU98_00165, partial [Deltaproteobacteria bacterium]|nr:hypothetical protein [Deltaproteobacteria bacterium]
LIQTGGETIRELVQSEFTHVKSFVEEKVKPTIQNVQSIPVVQQELKNLKDRLETLEKKLKKKR